MLLGVQRLLVDLAAVHLGKLFFPPAVDRHSSLLDKFHRDLVRLDDSTGPVPVLGRSHVDDVGAPEDGEFALEEPEGFGAGTECFVSMEMLFENVAEGGRIT